MTLQFDMPGTLRARQERVTKWSVFGNISAMYIIVHDALCLVIGFLYAREPVNSRENS